jgi:integrase
VKFREYAEAWIERYHGNGRRGFTEDTRDDYRRDLRRYAYPFFDDRLGGRRLTAISPTDVAEWIAWLCDKQEQDRHLADATVRRIVAPLPACLATARREGLVRHNPADGAVLPARPQPIEDHVDEEGDDEGPAQALGGTMPRNAPSCSRESHRLTFEFLVATGLRWSEFIAARWPDLRLDGSAPCVRVRRARSYAAR